MAQDIFFFCLRGDEGPGLDAALVRSILTADTLPPLYDDDLRYRDGSCCLEYSIEPDGEENSTGLRCLNFRRFGGRMFMERLFALAQTLDVVLAWTDTYGDDPSACVVGADKLGRLNATLKTVLNPVEARDAAHLNELIVGATFEACGW